MKKLSLTLNLAALAAVTLGSAGTALASGPEFIPVPIRLPSSSWSNLTASQVGMCNSQENFCETSGAVGEFEIYWNGSTGVDSNPLLEFMGFGGDGDPWFTWPFACNDQYAEGATTCTPNENLPCCPTQVQASNGPGTSTLQLDANGNAWWVNSATHHVHVFVRGAASDVDVDALTGGNVPWASVGVGAPVATNASPYPYGQVWAVSTSGSTYSLLGYIDQTGAVQSFGWLSIPGTATGVAFMNETGSASCSTTWHTPWVSTAGGGIYRFIPYGTACLDGSWQQLPGAAIAVTGNDIVLGTDHQIYKWNNAANAFDLTLQPSLPAGDAIETIGAQVGNASITMTDTLHNLWAETCGFFGC